MYSGFEHIIDISQPTFKAAEDHPLIYDVLSVSYVNLIGAGH
jgi:hypothetical protein